MSTGRHEELMMERRTLMSNRSFKNEDFDRLNLRSNRVGTFVDDLIHNDSLVYSAEVKLFGDCEGQCVMACIDQ